MGIGLAFWIIFLFVILLGVLGWNVNPDNPYRTRIFGGWGLLILILIFLLGWAEFGFILQGSDSPRHRAEINQGEAHVKR